MDDARISHYLEMWKQTIAVQQHFNDIEWRIRGLALTALTFALGAAAVAAREKSTIQLFDWRIQLSSSLLSIGLILWLAFYFVDQIWYHRLLIGAVKHGEALEVTLREKLPEAGLTHAISANSPYPVNFKVGVITIGSSAKMRIFYGIGGLTMFFLALALQFGS
ncbi:hypothetical protein AB0407_12555 [Streptomyces microflavus]|uniref:Uncharacterized protein n=1 Tax=Streptomyces microflavus DSM 40593 TaxID=1303692 RepID=N0CT83_STRMI|nr:hypothetical protein [Streptomyces microflavus]AGK76783.1 hypothetical protein SFUL_1815 [Streptomyces microflavus DSM 40593]